MQRKFEGFQFWAKSKRQRALDFVARDLVGHDNSPKKHPAAISFVGDMATNGSPKGNGPVPAIACREHLAKKGLLVLVDEFRTSCMCSSCGNATDDKMYHPQQLGPRFRCSNCKGRFSKKDPGDVVCDCGQARGTQLIDVYKTFICKRCDATFDRDENAADNMMEIVMKFARTGMRPTYLCRWKCKQ